MRAQLVLLLLLLAGCTSVRESGAVSGIESSTLSLAPAPEPATPSGPGAINSTWSHIQLDGAAAFLVDVAEGKERHDDVVLDIYIHNASGPWGYHVLQKQGDTWVPAGFHFDGPLSARTWINGSASEEATPVVQGRRMMPLWLGELAHAFGVVYVAATNPDGSARAYAASDAYVMVLGSQGPIDLSIRLANQNQLQFQRSGSQISLMSCGPNWMIDSAAVDWHDLRCPEAVVPPAADVLPFASWSRFTYTMFYERTTADTAHHLAVGGEAVDNSPVGHRPGTVIRSAQYETAPQQGPGWGQSNAYVIDSNSAGRWAHDVDLYNTGISWQGPLAGGPSPIFHQASDLVVGGPWWSCFGSGSGEGRTRLAVDSVGHPASGGLDQLMVAHVDHGGDLASVLGGAIRTGCNDLGPLYVLKLV